MTHVLLASALVLSAAAHAQDHRQKTKNTWRNIAIGSAALGTVGLIKGNSTLALLGLGGGLYAADRYEHDRKSQKQDERRRAALYRRKSFRDEHGHLYVRKTVWKNHHRYYKFVRAS